VRLTLRTLLAYLDDILEPAQAKEIGEKLSQSDYAETLVSRIREVMRRRRLAAPGLEELTSGLDANKVSEYLDNTLSPDSVADIERVCLSSDVHLAEVAACHQILTLVLGEPVEIVSECRERMYALGPLANTESQEARGTSSDQNGEKSTQPRVDASNVAPKFQESFQDSIPDYLKRKPVWRRVIPYAAFVLPIGVLLALIATDPAFDPVGYYTQNDSVQNNGVQNGEIPNQNIEPEPESGQEKIQTTERASSANQQPNDAISRTNVSDPTSNQSLPSPQSVVDVEQNSSHMPPAPAAVVVQPPPDASVEPTPAKISRRPVVAVAPKSQPKIPEPVVEKSPLVQYISPVGILLRYDALEDDWFVLPPRSLIQPEDRLASAEPFHSIIEVGKGLFQVTVQGGTSVRALAPSKVGPFGFKIERGRLVIRSRKMSQSNNGKLAEPGVMLAIAVKDELWRVEFLESYTICGIEIEPGQPFGLEEEAKSFTGGLYVLAGSVRFSDGSGNIRVIHSAANDGWMSLTPDERKAAFDPNTSVAATPLLTIPSWLDPKARRASSSTQLFFKEFPKVAMDLQDQQGMSLIVPAIVSDPRPRISELAVKCLAMTQSYQWLVKALAETEHEESRAAAIYGLRTWLPTSPENGKLLRAELQQFFSSEFDVETMYRLLWGFDKNDAQDKITSYQLVEWLGHDHVAVRQLAFYHVFRLTGRRFDYGPILPSGQRRSAVNRWLNHLDKEGALVSE
jgi:hypothetical protein